VLKCRTDGTGQDDLTGKLKIVLTDWEHNSVTQEIGASCPAHVHRWGDIILPMKLFEKLDWDQLVAMKFILSAENKNLEGHLFIDEIAFFGFNDVAFESHRDNLVGFPRVSFDEERRKALKEEKKSSKMLRGIAEDTWQYFLEARDRHNHLVIDHVRVGDSPLAADYTSPTNIAMDLMTTVAAQALEFITEEEAIERIQKIFESVRFLRRFHGLFYNFYGTKKLSVTRNYISSVDNGWLAVAMVVIRQAYPNVFAEKATEILNKISFEEFLDPENNQLVVGFDIPRREFGNYHYGMLVSEARVMSFYAIGKGDLPQSHWWFLYRTPPKSWTWQTQEPNGKYTTREGIEYFQGYYKHNGRKFVPSWGGSLFEVLMPTLVLKEKEIGQEGLGRNAKTVTKLHRDYALKEKEYPVWGISPAATSNGRRWKYEEFGVKALSAKGYGDRGVITPHVSFLALDSLPAAAIRNIRELLNFEKIYGAYGFFDSVNLRNKKVNPQYLALDQGMILIAIANYLKKGIIQETFHRDPIAKRAERLLKEKFY